MYIHVALSVGKMLVVMWTPFLMYFSKCLNGRDIIFEWFSIDAIDQFSIYVSSIYFVEVGTWNSIN